MLSPAHLSSVEQLFRQDDQMDLGVSQPESTGVFLKLRLEAKPDPDQQIIVVEDLEDWIKTPNNCTVSRSR